ncbi:carbon-nitrogen hydrolase family protein [Mycobacterium dioxanotrophicus]|uniref:Carbon-nitrogen hydrolase family protein n=1 Tax=Mycobacterium dioxanotrophicus TaxID=482462 RepID=A0A1Y0C3B6_9MYCO|nr:carbon-nitrogen hydrolase family protein [Mycobacterium dioxanotrophicus]ART69693.1 carbon-nitrogen hydrolase family protein [Mycobacterium dioxanotrophicus]
MPGSITVAAVQAAPLAMEGLPVFGRTDTVAEFTADVVRVREAVAGPALIVYPEIHLFGTDDAETLAKAAEPLDGPLIAALGEVARTADAWLVPGSVLELGDNGELFNTAPVFAPDGSLAASYRKIFPWRPYEKFTPGDTFVTVDIPDVGRLGLSICYDAWFPELSRHLAWMGADVIINVVKTTTPDRFQELVLARANSIVNQVFTVSVNCAGPVGMGRSIIVDPEGAVLQESPDETPEVFYQHIDFGAVAAVRERGTAGTNRMWDQFGPSDRSIPLPLYGGRIDPQRWSPSNHHAE